MKDGTVLHRTSLCDPVAESKNPLSILIYFMPHGSHFNRLSGADDQTSLQLVLELLYMLADRRLGNIQLLCGFTETIQPYDGSQGLQMFKFHGRHTF